YRQQLTDHDFGTACRAAEQGDLGHTRDEPARWLISVYTSISTTNANTIASATRPVADSSAGALSPRTAPQLRTSTLWTPTIHTMTRPGANMRSRRRSGCSRTRKLAPTRIT